jgi:hypothetical protein
MLLADTASSCCGDTHSEAGDSIKGRPTFGQRRWVVEVGFLCPHSDAHTAADDAFALSSIMPGPFCVGIQGGHHQKESGSSFYLFIQ